MDEIVLSIKDFRKTYGDFVAVSGIGFEVQRGEILVCLDPTELARRLPWSAWKASAGRMPAHCASWASTPAGNHANCAT